MYTITESDYATLHTLNRFDMKFLWTSFQISFPFSMDILVTKDDADRMLVDAQEMCGDAHPPHKEYRNDTFSWSQYHPKADYIHTAKGLCISTVVGFKNSKDAVAFALKWFRS